MKACKLTGVLEMDRLLAALRYFSVRSLVPSESCLAARLCVLDTFVGVRGPDAEEGRDLAFPAPFFRVDVAEGEKGLSSLDGFRVFIAARFTLTPGATMDPLTGLFRESCSDLPELARDRDESELAESDF